MSVIKHPAKYNDSFLPIFAKMLQGSENILDPFAGTGKVFSLLEWIPSLKIEAVEIEKEWCDLDPRITLGNALNLTYPDNYFDAIITSPTYGNAMGGKLSKDIDKGKWHRIKYSDYLHRELNQNNSANFQWGEKYRKFHVSAWKEARRVLKNKGTFILNIKNHIRKGVEQFVTEWHIETLVNMGFKVDEHLKVPVPSMKFGENSDKRVPFESIIKFELIK